MFESIMNFFKKLGKSENKETKSKETAKERLHLVLMQDRANVSADFLEMMKQEIIEVIKKYIEVDEKEIDVRLTNEVKEDGTTGAPSLYANIPIVNIKNDMKKEVGQQANKKVEDKKDKETVKEEPKKEPKEEQKTETKKDEEKPTEEKKVEKNESKQEETEKKPEKEQEPEKEKKEDKKDIEEENKKENNENKSGE
ncbi:MAG: cell division topological specificity factor MinE [Clostridia bacterium]